MNSRRGRSASKRGGGRKQSEELTLLEVSPDEKADVAKLKLEINEERMKERNRQVLRARRTKKTIPSESTGGWTNELIKELEVKLHVLMTSAKPDILDAPPAPSVITEGSSSNIPAIVTRSRCVVKQAARTEEALPATTDHPSPSYNHPASLTCSPSPTCSRLPTHSPSPITHLQSPTVKPASVCFASVSPAADGVEDDCASLLQEHDEDTGPVEHKESNDEYSMRAGTIMKEQLVILREEQARRDKWDLDRAREWRLSPITIKVNMGSDNREQRVTSLWNMFQAVFWDEVSDEDWEITEREEEERKRGEKENKGREKAGEPVEDKTLWPKGKLATLREKCSVDYAPLKELITKPDSLTQEDRAACEVQKKRVEERYLEIHDPSKINVKEGDTQKLIRKARKEFTMRAGHFWPRGLAIMGVIVNVDPMDPVASASNVIFAGCDPARRYVDLQKGNMKLLLRDFETFCRSEEMDERKRRKLSLDQLYLAHKDHNGQRRAEIASLLKEMWAKAMDVQIPYAVPWDRWSDDMPSLHSCLEGWPDDVPWPGGPKAYKALEAAKVTAALWPYICNQKEQEVRIEKWPAEQIELAKRLTPKEQATNETYNSICLVRGASRNSLMTIGEMTEQAAARLEDKRDITRRAADRIKEDQPERGVRGGGKGKKRKADENDQVEGDGVEIEGDKVPTKRKKAKLFEKPVVRKVDVVKKTGSLKAKTVKTKAWVSDDEGGGEEEEPKVSSLGKVNAVLNKDGLAEDSGKMVGIMVEGHNQRGGGEPRSTSLDVGGGGSGMMNVASMNGASAVSGGNDAQGGSHPVMPSSGLAGQPAFNLQNIMSGGNIDLSNLTQLIPDAIANQLRQQFANVGLPIGGKTVASHSGTQGTINPTLNRVGNGQIQDQVQGQVQAHNGHGVILNQNLNMPQLPGGNHMSVPNDLMMAANNQGMYGGGTDFSLPGISMNGFGSGSQGFFVPNAGFGGQNDWSGV
ncbi:hypothetical protein M422DRAFT_265531 [Sphaerobolus stellatus SS14]|uniref:Uncharacterized protein n=1 Tax=Sphaerobolus stellatus (strain SS14) TaxID=990650 RepID=A0A0C9V5E7_SPHS4|nr:hypothetical protein M422DRAFT_265531 [Sphaerobolus stellatus SS14]